MSQHGSVMRRALRHTGWLAAAMATFLAFGATSVSAAGPGPKVSFLDARGTGHVHGAHGAHGQPGSKSPNLLFLHGGQILPSTLRPVRSSGAPAGTLATRSPVSTRSTRGVGGTHYLTPRASTPARMGRSGRVPRTSPTASLSSTPRPGRPRPRGDGPRRGRQDDREPGHERLLPGLRRPAAWERRLLRLAQLRDRQRDTGRDRVLLQPRWRPRLRSGRSGVGHPRARGPRQRQRPRAQRDRHRPPQRRLVGPAGRGELGQVRLDLPRHRVDRRPGLEDPGQLEQQGLQQPSRVRRSGLHPDELVPPGAPHPEIQPSSSRTATTVPMTMIATRRASGESRRPTTAPS